MQAVQTVLVVEDDEDVSSILGFALKQAGVERVLLAATGEEGLALARAESPDLILCDLMLPGIDGLELVRRLREGPDPVEVAVIFVTAAANTAFRHRSPQDYGAIGALSKPFDMLTLWQQVQGMLARAERPS